MLLLRFAADDDAIFSLSAVAITSNCNFDDRVRDTPTDTVARSTTKPP